MKDSQDPQILGTKLQGDPRLEMQLQRDNQDCSRESGYQRELSARTLKRERRAGCEDREYFRVWKQIEEVLRRLVPDTEGSCLLTQMKKGVL